jgi:hypothetical protein
MKFLLKNSGFATKKYVMVLAARFKPATRGEFAA